jgi:hypothetical protein
MSCGARMLPRDLLQGRLAPAPSTAGGKLARAPEEVRYSRRWFLVANRRDEGRCRDAD